MRYSCYEIHRRQKDGCCERRRKGSLVWTCTVKRLSGSGGVCFRSLLSPLFFYLYLSFSLSFSFSFHILTTTFTSQLIKWLVKHLHTYFEASTKWWKLRSNLCPYFLDYTSLLPAHPKIIIVSTGASRFIADVIISDFNVMWACCSIVQGTKLWRHQIVWRDAILPETDTTWVLYSGLWVYWGI